MDSFPEKLKQLKAKINFLIKEKKYSKISDKIDQLHKEIIHKNNSLEDYNSEQLTNKFEQQLIENEKYLEIILNSVNSGVVLIDPETHIIVDVNRGALKMFERERKDVIGKECFNFICPTEKGKCPVTDLKKRVEDSVRELTTKKGEIKYILKNVKKIEIEGKPFLLETFTDIHKQKSVEHELKILNEELEGRIIERTKELCESEEKYRSLIENLKHKYFFYKHNINGVFEYVSPSVKNVLGYSQKEFQTHYTNFLKDNPLNIKAVKKTEQSIKGIQQKPFELEIFDSENNVLILEVSESPLFDENNKVIAVEGIVHDITKQKEDEETINHQLDEIKIQNEQIKLINEEIYVVNDDLERRIEDINKLNENLKISEEKLKVLNTKKDKFFSLISHDLRSQIGNFVQISDLLNQKHKELSEDQANMFFSNLSLLANSTFKLLENLLMWSRSQLGRLKTKNENVNVYKIVEEVRDLCDENIKTKGLELVNNISEELNIYADYNIVYTVFRNLIYNALKFTSKGGIITVKSKNEIVSQNKTEIILIVQDTGIGISKSNIEKIFNIDYDYTALGTEKEKGTGLGLILCKELIEKNGGGIWVESKVGEGSKFYFTLKP
jgi:PAS domain S-box-containing protein